MFLTITLRQWRMPRYTTGRGRSYRVFSRLHEAREYAESKGYCGIRITCK